MLPLLAAAPALAGIQLYRGALAAVTAPSTSCEGVLGKHPMTLIIIEDSTQTGLTGYLESDVLAVGKLAGSDPAHLRISYPGQDNSGNTMSLSRSGATKLTGELNGAITVKLCTFDIGRLTLDLVDDEKAAAATLQRLATRFDAQSALYQCISLTNNRDCKGALPLFEKFLGQDETVYDQDSISLLKHYVSGLSNCYAKLGRTREFNALLDQRISAAPDETLKRALTELRVNILNIEGHKLLDKAEYEAALKTFMQAYQLDPRNMDSIHTVMAVYVRSGRNDEAIAFLEQAGAKLEQAADRKEINDIIALVYFYKGMRDDKKGNEAEAEASLLKAVTLNPQRVQYLAALARMRHKAGHFDEAEKLLSQGLERITDESSRREIMAVLEKLRQTEMIIKKLKSGG